MSNCYCGVIFESKNPRQFFHNQRCGERFHQLIDTRELFRLSEEDLGLRGKALNYRDRYMRRKNY